jgi:hypothetical protein
MPVLAALADALRDEGFHVEHSYPQEQRSIEAAAAVFVALRLLDVAGDEAIKGAATSNRSSPSAEIQRPRLASTVRTERYSSKSPSTRTMLALPLNPPERPQHPFPHDGTD